ncbi:tRNA (adenine(22)-N(1))-methyltransferase TrmK [Virgibacillus profundi]|uniref:tRNA (Adenine(22)-N(1))-methyltransferase TrmK n=1 Tax=Virgibacillus profundi TaxID=2024555 RepID=A0A2A2ICP7_9BACI|nr:tRNA (adenine(22)-N(1))-methyltransferase TrmK [Virgibacillus profundi]PAV29044.1 tRNA (adenine(22)-N(1))-methyltransferase TrmK [Virgibacillus profundi]PXY53213.1 tRNA (adenine(22)-N(1))-methyltransferase TrmK [Virgibacillus profundi]
MTNSIKLSKRLSKVASYLPEGALFADIGSDHAYLPCYVCLHDNTAKAIAGELNVGPYNSAVDTVNQHELSKVIEVRLGNGLQILNKGEVRQLVIAGIGGPLIKTILDEGIQKLDGVERIIAQPNIDAGNVRKWFYENGFTITNEAILEESGHIYEIVVADKNAAANPFEADDLEKQLLFGPLLLKEKTEVFFYKWKTEYEKLQRVIDQMNKATIKNDKKIQQFQKELKWMKEVLMNEK